MCMRRGEIFFLFSYYLYNYGVSLIDTKEQLFSSNMHYRSLVGCVILACALSVHALSFNTPYTVKYGVYITGGTQGDAIRTLDAVWSLHVIVGRPKQPVQLFQQISRIQAIINSSALTRHSDKSIQASWLQRLQLLDLHLAPAMATDHRHRRGLIDAGGILLRNLFGLATTSQVDISRRLIQQVRIYNHMILHKTNKLISVVNQTFDELVRHRQHIMDLETSISDLYEHIKTWQSVRDVAYKTLRANIRIDNALSVLEQQKLRWTRQLSRYRRQRLALMSGKLTESLLPVTDLNIILTHSRSRGFFAARTVWYYEFVKILPLWEDEDHVVYIAHLPLAGHNSYLRYSIITWPFVIPSTNFTMPLQLPRDIAYDTTGGLMFEPQQCHGWEPEICQTGPLYSKSSLKCIRGVLTSEPLLRKSCRVHSTEQPWI